MAEENFLPEDLLDVKRVRPGDIVVGKVEVITPDGVVLNIGTKEDAILPADEASGLKVGDEVSVMVMRRDPEGTYFVSRKKLLERELLEKVMQAYRNGTPVKAKVLSFSGRGFKVVVEGVLEAFVPISEMDAKRVESPEEYLGKEFLFRVKDVSQRGGRRIVLSRRAYLEDEKNRKKMEAFQRLEENKVVRGRVLDVKDYGAFISLDDENLLVGLLRRENLSWGRRLNPRKLFKVGDEVEVMVLKVDKENQKIELSTKHLRQDPWELIQGKPYIEKEFPVGSDAEGVVVHLENYGAFVALNEDVEGLVHISEMTWGRKPRHPREVLKVGDRVKVRIKDIDPQRRKVALSLRDIYENPWVGAEERYPVGSVVKVKVVGHENGKGVLVEFPDGIREFIPYSEFPSSMKIPQIKSKYPPGSEVEGIVTSVDVEKERIRVSPKELEKKRLESRVLEKFPYGHIVEGKVVKIIGRGVILDIGDKFSAFVPRGEVSSYRFRNIEEVISAGSKVRAKVIGFDAERKNLIVSIRAYEEEQQKKEMEKYTREKAITLGEVLNLEEIKKNIGESEK